MSFSRAAHACHMSQPALSANIKKLEEVLDARLFDRHTKNVALTAVGREFYGLAEFCFLLTAFLAYQIQNLFVFDTVPASLMFFAFAGFAGYIWGIAKSEKKNKTEPSAKGLGLDRGTDSGWLPRFSPRNTP